MAGSKTQGSAGVKDLRGTDAENLPPPLLREVYQGATLAGVHDNDRLSVLSSHLIALAGLDTLVVPIQAVKISSNSAALSWKEIPQWVIFPSLISWRHSIRHHFQLYLRGNAILLAQIAMVGLEFFQTTLHGPTDGLQATVQLQMLSHVTHAALNSQNHLVQLGFQGLPYHFSL